jgi:hypothetical protein
MALQPISALAFSLWGSSLDEWSARRKAATYTGQHKRRQTSMPLAGFEPTIPAFKGAKTFHALDPAATVTGLLFT